MHNKYPQFMPGLELSRAYFKGVVEPLLTKHFPHLKYAAALTGNGSDTLGFDSPTSMDHNWGPRLQLFLTYRDYLEVAPKIDAMLRSELPYTFKGFPTNFTKEDPTAYLKIQMEHIESGEVNHYIEIFTIRSFLKHYLGFDRDNEITIKDWLTFPQQALLEVTSGEVFRDDLGELTKIRETLSFFPKDIWLYMIRVGWGRMHVQTQFVARTGAEGDELGSRILAAKMIEEIMRLVFLFERQYAPYSKWFGTKFKKRLKNASKFIPLFEAILNATNWKEREQKLAECWQLLGNMHNALGITEPQSTELTDFHGRGYTVMNLEPFVLATENAISDPEVKNLHYMLGQIDQFINHVRINHEDYVFRVMKHIIR